MNVSSNEIDCSYNCYFMLIGNHVVISYVLYIN